MHHSVGATAFAALLAVLALAGCSETPSAPRASNSAREVSHTAEQPQPVSALACPEDPLAIDYPKTKVADHPQLRGTVCRATTGWEVLLHLTGAQPGESIDVAVEEPTVTVDNQVPHIAAPNGEVTAWFLSNDGDPTGNYNVTATGNAGTHAQLALIRTASTMRLAKETGP